MEIEIDNQIRPYVLLENYIFKDGEKEHKNAGKWEWNREKKQKEKKIGV